GSAGYYSSGRANHTEQGANANPATSRFLNSEQSANMIGAAGWDCASLCLTRRITAGNQGFSDIWIFSRRAARKP
ncbi:MAG TPA: hypothetical protein VLT16_14145, partial [Candidatus Limnocylindrales bacterium]|nr:hypothetical protein [Candidatus Limnocylindrales bacterium]